jgi:hypothetical protein
LLAALSFALFGTCLLAWPADGINKKSLRQQEEGLMQAYCKHRRSLWKGWFVLTPSHLSALGQMMRMPKCLGSINTAGLKKGDLRVVWMSVMGKKHTHKHHHRSSSGSGGACGGGTDRHRYQ